jgi:hypothetical protein
MAKDRPGADEHETDAGDQLERERRQVLLGGAAERHGERAGCDQSGGRGGEDPERIPLTLGREEQSGELGLVAQFREEHGDENRQELLHWRSPQEPDEEPMARSRAPAPVARIRTIGLAKPFLAARAMAPAEQPSQAC